MPCWKQVHGGVQCRTFRLHMVTQGNAHSTASKASLTWAEQFCILCLAIPVEAFSGNCSRQGECGTTLTIRSTIPVLASSCISDQGDGGDSWFHRVAMNGRWETKFERYLFNEECSHLPYLKPGSAWSTEASTQQSHNDELELAPCLRQHRYNNSRRTL